MRGTVALSLLLGAVLAQQPEQAHLALTGKPGELSLDYISHRLNCSAVTWGAQLATSPDFSEADFVPASGCVDFTAQSPALALAVQVLFTGLVPGTTYYYVCGTEGLNEPWSQVYSFVYNSGSVREGGPVYAVLADFGCVRRPGLHPARLPSNPPLRPRFPALAGTTMLNRYSSSRRTPLRGALTSCCTRGTWQ